MKLKTIVPVIAIGLQLVLAGSPFIPWLSGVVYNGGDLTKRLSVDRTLMGVYFALLTISVSILLAKRDSEQAADTKHVLEILRNSGGVSLQTIGMDEFYKSFLASAKSAKHSVCISYFDNSPPPNANAARKKYYSELLSWIKKGEGAVRVRRLVRQSPANDAWVAGMIEQLRGVSRADIGILTDVSPIRDSLSLSVQIVDDSNIWLVALDSHEQAGPYRDVQIMSGTAGQALRLYYNRLWRMSTVVLDAGSVTPAGEELLSRLGKRA